MNSIGSVAVAARSTPAPTPNYPEGDEPGEVGSSSDGGGDSGDGGNSNSGVSLNDLIELGDAALYAAVGDAKGA